MNVKYNKLGKSERRRRPNRSTTVAVPADDNCDTMPIVHSANTDDEFDDEEEEEECQTFARTWEMFVPECNTHTHESKI